MEERKKTRPYLKIYCDIWRELNHNEKLLYAMMKDYAGAGGICFASVRSLKKEMGVGYATLLKTREALLKKELLSPAKAHQIYTERGRQWIDAFYVNEASKGAVDNPQKRAQGVPVGEHLVPVQKLSVPPQDTIYTPDIGVKKNREEKKESLEDVEAISKLARKKTDDYNLTLAKHQKEANESWKKETEKSYAEFNKKRIENLKKLKEEFIKKKSVTSEFADYEQSLGYMTLA